MHCAFGLLSETRATLAILPEWLWFAPLEMVTHDVARMGPDSGDCIYALKLSRLFMVEGTNCLIFDLPAEKRGNRLSSCMPLIVLNVIICNNCSVHPDKRAAWD